MAFKWLFGKPLLEQISKAITIFETEKAVQKQKKRTISIIGFYDGHFDIDIAFVCCQNDGEPAFFYGVVNLTFKWSDSKFYE